MFTPETKIRSYGGYGSIYHNNETILVVAETNEYFVNGDIALVTKYYFTSAKTWRKAGSCTVVERDAQHIQYIPSSKEGNEEEMARKFQSIQ